MEWLEAAWVSTVAHVSHVRCLMKVARISKIEVRLTLVKLVMSIQVNSVRIDVVGLVLHMMLVLHMVLPGRRKLTISLSNRRIMVLMAMWALVLAVQLFTGADAIEIKVGKSSTDLCHDTPSASRVSDSTVAMSIRSPRLGSCEMWPHCLDQADSLRMSCDRQCALHNVIAEWIHH
jgi:hypothetical protein